MLDRPLKHDHDNSSLGVKDMKRVGETFMTWKQASYSTLRRKASRPCRHHKLRARVRRSGAQLRRLGQNICVSTNPKRVFLIQSVCTTQEDSSRQLPKVLPLREESSTLIEHPNIQEPSSSLPDPYDSNPTFIVTLIQSCRTITTETTSRASIHG